MSITDSQKQATAKYKRLHYDQIQLRIPAGGRTVLQLHAARHDSSANAFIIRAIRQALEDDGADADTITAICGDGHGIASK